MIMEIEKKLEDFNNASNFSDTNLVARIIEKIEKNQNNLCSYIRSMFLFLSFLNFTSKVALIFTQIIIECLLLATPFFFYKNMKTFSIEGYPSLVQFIGFVLSISYLNIAILLNYLLTIIINKIMTRKLVFIILVISISICILINLQIFNNLWEYIICYLVLFTFISMVESIYIIY
jgi:hypothetical protein